MGKKGTVQSPDGSWLVTWSTSWWYINYEAQDLKTGIVFRAVWIVDGWVLVPDKGSPPEASVTEVDDEMLLETLQRASDDASRS
jgi:hypothetical protein